MGRPLFPWLALAAGVVGVGAAALQDRRGSRATQDRTVVEYRDPKYGRTYGYLVRRDGDTVHIRAMGGGLSFAYPADTVIRTLTEDEYLQIVPEHGRGSAAVDAAKRYRDLQRMAAPGSGASDNERAMAKRLLAKMTPPPQQAPRATRRSTASSESGFGRWADKYHPWQTDPRDRGEIYRNDLTDLNFAKKSIYEHASAPRVRVTLHGFDGSYGRSMLTAFSSLDDLGYAAKVLEAWGEPHFKRDGVFDAVIGMVKGESDARVLRIRGEDVSGLGLSLDHESFNENPFNDSAFGRRLRALVEAHAARMR